MPPALTFVLIFILVLLYSVWRRKLEKKAQNDENSSEMVGAAPIDGHRSLKIRAGRKVDSEEICPYAARDLAFRR